MTANSTLAPDSVNRSGFQLSGAVAARFSTRPSVCVITGWNEWTAGRWSAPDKPIMFSGSIQSRNSAATSNRKREGTETYYTEMVANIGATEGAPSLPATFTRATQASNWDGHVPAMAIRRSGIPARSARAEPRDFIGVGGLHYTTTLAATILPAFKVAHDSRNIYF